MRTQPMWIDHRHKDQVLSAREPSSCAFCTHNTTIANKRHTQHACFTSCLQLQHWHMNFTSNNTPFITSIPYTAKPPFNTNCTQVGPNSLHSRISRMVIKDKHPPSQNIWMNTHLSTITLSTVALFNSTMSTACAVSGVDELLLSMSTVQCPVPLASDETIISEISFLACKTVWWYLH